MAALTKQAIEAAEFLKRVHDVAATRGKGLVDNLHSWIDPDSVASDYYKAVLWSVVSDAVQNGPLQGTIYGLKPKIDYYRKQLDVVMSAVERAARSWTLEELTRQEVRLLSILTHVHLHRTELHLAAKSVKDLATSEKFQLPQMTAEEMKEVTGESGDHKGTVVTRLTRVEYMYVVRLRREEATRKAAGAGTSPAGRTPNKTTYDHLFYLMAHPQGVSLVSAFAHSPARGAEYAKEMINECLSAIRTLRINIANGSTLIWRFPPAVAKGVIDLGLGRDPAYTRLALAWANTRKSFIERTLDVAGNAVFALGLVGGVFNLVAEVLDLVLAVIGTAVSFIRDTEQAQAATATAFAGKDEKLSKGSRGLGTILQGAATVIQAAMLPATVSRLTKRAPKIGKAASKQALPPAPSNVRRETVASRGVNRDATDGTKRGVGTVSDETSLEKVAKSRLDDSVEATKAVKKPEAEKSRGSAKPGPRTPRADSTSVPAGESTPEPGAPKPKERMEVGAQSPHATPTSEQRAVPPRPRDLPEDPYDVARFGDKGRLRQVQPYEGSALAKAVHKRRRALMGTEAKVPFQRNMAALEFENPRTGKLEMRFAVSVKEAGYERHAEKVLIENLQHELGNEFGYHLIDRLYTERIPCRQPEHNCYGWIRRELKDAIIEFSFAGEMGEIGGTGRKVVTKTATGELSQFYKSRFNSRGKREATLVKVPGAY